MKIPSTFETRRLNSMVEAFDRDTNFAHDRADLWVLAIEAERLAERSTTTCDAAKWFRHALALRDVDRQHVQPRLEDVNPMAAVLDEPPQPFKVFAVTPEIIGQMRDWLKDCQWADMEQDQFDLLTDQQVIDGVKCHYDGGLEAFLKSFELNQWLDNQI